MKKLLLYGHGGAFNHGAEAILRASLPIFRRAGVPIYLSTHFPEQDRAFGLDQLVDRSISADLSLVQQEKAAPDYTSREQLAARIYRDALAEIDDGTICIGVGGDNYCYPNWHRQSIFHRTAKERGGFSILWGCSVQPEQISGQMEEVLQSHDHIFARESLTANALRERGIGQVTQLPDPAFLLPPEPVTLPEAFHGQAAAINLSPLLLRQSMALMGAFVETARLLLTKADVLLLAPHVTMPTDDDKAALSELASLLTAEEQRRLCWIPEEANAAQRKYMISRCELLVCCRTHASIAAYSTGVPVLVVGYSVKSQGIGKDLGMERWTLSAENAKHLPRLAGALWERRREVRGQLLQQQKAIAARYSSSPLWRNMSEAHVHQCLNTAQTGSNTV